MDLIERPQKKNQKVQAELIPKQVEQKEVAGKNFEKSGKFEYSKAKVAEQLH